MRRILKQIFLSAVFSLLPFLGHATETQKMIAKFIITDASQNGVDITPTYLENGAYFVFYSIENDNSLYMANFFPKADTQSNGAVYSFENSTLEETADQYKVDIFNFNWRYINTYDSKKGTAKVQVSKIYKPQGIGFVIKIIPENLDILIYKGYMDGTVDFSSYN